MTRSNVIMASAPASSAVRSQAWISTVRFTTESEHIGPGAAPLGRHRGRRPARWELWWWSHRGLSGGGRCWRPSVGSPHFPHAPARWERRTSHAFGTRVHPCRSAPRGRQPGGPQGLRRSLVGGSPLASFAIDTLVAVYFAVSRSEVPGLIVQSTRVDGA